MQAAWKHKKKNWIVHLILIVGAIVMVTPFFWMVSTSLKSFAESMKVPPNLVPSVLHLENFANVIEKINFTRYYVNTIAITVGRTVGQLLLCSLAAFAFARLRFPGNNVIFVGILSVLMVPSQVVLIPSFVLMRELNWIDTYYALIVPGIFSAFGTFLMRQFFLTIPKDMDEAAKVDGSSLFGIYWRIFLPLARSALISLAIITVLAAWNDLLWPLTMTSSDEMRVLSIGISSFQGQHGTDYPLLMAGALMATLPMILMFILLQRYFIEGIAVSGIKG